MARSGGRLLPTAGAVVPMSITGVTLVLGAERATSQRRGGECGDEHLPLSGRTGSSKPPFILLILDVLDGREEVRLRGQVVVGDGCRKSSACRSITASDAEAASGAGAASDAGKALDAGAVSDAGAA